MEEGVFQIHKNKRNRSFTYDATINESCLEYRYYVLVLSTVSGMWPCCEWTWQFADRFLCSVEGELDNDAMASPLIVWFILQW